MESVILIYWHRLVPYSLISEGFAFWNRDLGRKLTISSSSIYTVREIVRNGSILLENDGDEPFICFVMLVRSRNKIGKLRREIDFNLVGIIQQRNSTYSECFSNHRSAFYHDSTTNDQCNWEGKKQSQIATKLIAAKYFAENL